MLKRLPTIAFLVIVCLIPVSGFSLAGECKCSANSGVVDDRDCTSCTQESLCASKTCKVAVAQATEPPTYQLKEQACVWEPILVDCACPKKDNWVAATTCARAENGQCDQDNTCLRVKIGYEGPLNLSHPSVQEVDCEEGE